MPNVRQLSFAAGEVSPALYGRVDQVKYATGLKRCKNFFVLRHGGVANRPGLKFDSEVKDSTKAVKLVPFVFNPSQTYVLEFGDQYMRVHRDGAQVTEAAKSITGATNANPCVVSITAHGYSNGQEVFISGVGGMTELNGRNFKVANVAAGTFSLQYMDGTDVDSTLFGVYTSGGTAARVYEIATPYLEADLAALQYAQTADIVTLVHPSYAIRELKRTGHTAWTLTSFAVGASISAPTGVAVTGGGSAPATPTGLSAIGGSGSEGYKVTAFNETPAPECESKASAVQSSTGSGGNVNVTWNTVAGAEGYALYKYDAASGKYGLIYVGAAASYVDINGLDIPANSVKNAPEIASGAKTFSYVVTAVHAETTEESLPSTPASIGGTTDPSPTNPFTISWGAVSGAGLYNIYRLLNGVYGWIGVSAGTSFDDTGYNIDALDTPPEHRNPFSSDYPSTVAYYQQRAVFANTDSDPEGAWTSKIALRYNFNKSTPLQDDDPVTFALLGKQVNEIRHMIDVGRLILFTTSGEWAINGDPSGVLIPTAINPVQHSANGIGDLPPILVDGSAIYVQARGSIVRDLNFDYQTEGYRGNELSIFSSHLIDNYSIVDWTYQQIPHSVIWAVRDDGTLLGMTYVRNHQLNGWHRHSTDGFIENAVSVPEGSEDSLYLVVRRTIDGRTVRYVERMATRKIDDIRDSIFMDCAISYDGRNTGATTMTLTGGVTWMNGEDLTLTASTSFFSAADVGNGVHMIAPDGAIIRCEIVSYTSPTVVTVRSNRTVPVSLRGVATTTWEKAIKQLSGLWHLEGKDVAVFADGFVVANPLNDAYVTLTVTNGSVALSRPYSVIHAGLPYDSEIETLNIDTPGISSMSDRKKAVNSLMMFVETTRGLFAGPDEDNLTEFKLRSDEGYDDPPSLQTGLIDVNIRSEWNSGGNVIVKQIDPIPASILTVVPRGYMG